jgi:hypothetical protein
LYEVTPARLEALATRDADVKALIEDTDAAQQAALEEYLRIRRDHDGPPIHGDEAHWRKAATSDPYARAAVNLQDALGAVLWQNIRAPLPDSTGKPGKHCTARLGQRGIDHLVNRAEMEASVRRQQTLLSHWHKRLQVIREDRLNMIVAGHFHRAAWYYDFRNDAQIRHRLETEFVCVAALCGNREATEKLATYLQSNLLTVVPGLDTLTQVDQLDVSKKLMDLSSFSITLGTAPENLANVQVLSNQFRSLMNERLPNFEDLNTRFRGLQSLLDGAYNPARQLKIADRLDLALRDFRQGASIDPNSFIRDLGVPARLQLLREFFPQRLDPAGGVGGRNPGVQPDPRCRARPAPPARDTYKQRHRELARQIYGLTEPGGEQRLNQRIISLKTALVPLEDQLSRALTVGAEWALANRHRDRWHGPGAA